MRALQNPRRVLPDTIGGVRTANELVRRIDRFRHREVSMLTLHANVAQGGGFLVPMVRGEEESDRDDIVERRCGRRYQLRLARRVHCERRPRLRRTHLLKR